ncbi:hypothetical protein CTAYLR_000273 [Chrysophaeum taylorii]|uniref:Rab-GAP TBC domain-containing protein n=1 Tax=Chrysophaeum taylorii TaxID=2483200 RepID=A0AAD7XL17_9STRA|nr:hypothetical protein CTAYLR_000273 [Chrysophaeum taylorii]
MGPTLDQPCVVGGDDAKTSEWQPSTPPTRRDSAGDQEDPSRDRRHTPQRPFGLQFLMSSPDQRVTRDKSAAWPRTDGSAAAAVARWEALLRSWPSSCSSLTALRSRRTWRKKALELVAEHSGIPKEMRRKVWQTVLEAAVEASADYSSGAGQPPAAEVAPAFRPISEPIIPVSKTPPRDALITCGAAAADDDDDPPKPRQNNNNLPPLPDELDEPDLVGTLASNTAQSRSARPASGKDVPRWARPRRADDGRVSPRLLPREIALDVPRTFGGRDLVDEAAAFHTLAPDTTQRAQYIEQTRLRRLLVHFARTTPGVQYYQGMNFLGGTLLRVFEESDDKGIDRPPPLPPEEEMCSPEKTTKLSRSRRMARSTTIDAATAMAFRGLMALVTSLYVPDFSGLRELVAVAGSLLPRFAPKLASVLEAEGLDLMPITAAWCLTFFASSAMDFECVVCCWDFLILGTPSRREELMLPDETDDDDNDDCEVRTPLHDDFASPRDNNVKSAADALPDDDDDGGRGGGGGGGAPWKNKLHPPSKRPNGARRRHAFWSTSSSSKMNQKSAAKSTSPPGAPDDASDALSPRDRLGRDDDNAACYTPSEASSEATSHDNKRTPPQLPPSSSSKHTSYKMPFFSSSRQQQRRRRRRPAPAAETTLELPKTANGPPRNINNSQKKVDDETNLEKKKATNGGAVEQQQPVLARTKSQRRRDKALKNQSTTAERHSMLLRLCLVMLRLGERATWGRREECGEVDDLQSLSELLEAAQPSPVADADVSPGAASVLARQRSGCCFPSSTDVLCSLIAKTKVDPRTIRAYAKRYRKLQESPDTTPTALQPPGSTSLRPPATPPHQQYASKNKSSSLTSFFRSISRKPAHKVTRWRLGKHARRPSTPDRPSTDRRDLAAKTV